MTPNIAFAVQWFAGEHTLSVDRAVEAKGIWQPAQRVLLHVFPSDLLIWKVWGLGYCLGSLSEMMFNI